MNRLKVFDSICYKHVSDTRRKKLDNKRESMIHVGYKNSEAYTLFIPISDNIIISRDIVIDENYSIELDIK